MGFTGAGIAFDTVTTTQQAPLGFRLTVPDGDNGNKVYTYVKAAVEIGVGLACAKGAVAADAGYGAVLLGTAAMSDSRYVGVAQATIASGSYGFVLTRGVGNAKVNSEAAISDELVMHSSGGELDEPGAGDSNGPVGNVLGTLIAAGATGAVYLNFAG